WFFAELHLANIYISTLSSAKNCLWCGRADAQYEFTVIYYVATNVLPPLMACIPSIPNRPFLYPTPHPIPETNIEFPE
ncbi:MAG: hypothetical protein KDC86_19350, partial [Saprospiraceae bacterium]|nr:hypothetical protein [Saprospiraceae bacterium]